MVTALAYGMGVARELQVYGGMAAINPHVSTVQVVSKERWHKHIRSHVATNAAGPTSHTNVGPDSSGGRIRTCDLRVMLTTTAFAASHTGRLWSGLSLHPRSYR